MRKFLLAVAAIALTAFQGATATESESQLEGYRFAKYYKSKRVCKYKYVKKCKSYCHKKYKADTCGCDYFGGFGHRCGCLRHGICKW